MKNRQRLFLSALLLLSVTTSSCGEAGSVDPMKLDNWFYSRLVWMSLAAAVVGILVALIHLCRLTFSPGELNAKRQARKKFGVWLIIVFISGAIWLLVDAWSIYPFDELTSLNFGQAFLDVFLNYRTFVVLFVGIFVFSLFVAISTRFFKADCRCKYAFIGK
jgi:hypothetical protein